MIKFDKYMAIYKNVEITDSYIIGSIKDLIEYFIYEIASQGMGKEIDIENYIDNVGKMLDVIKNLQEDLMNDLYSENDVVKISIHPMGVLIIEEV